LNKIESPEKIAKDFLKLANSVDKAEAEVNETQQAIKNLPKDATNTTRK